jgi:hypothetical protein
MPLSFVDLDRLRAETTCNLVDGLQEHMVIHVYFHGSIISVFISYPNKERRRMFICGVSVAPKVSQVLRKLSTRIEMESGECK